MKSIADEIVDGNSSSILLNETSNRRDRVFPISAISHSVVPKQKSNKPKIFNEIPRYLVKISSTLFKKATAAEVFLNRLDEKKRKQANKLEEGKEDINIRDIDPEGSTNKTKENLITNLMSDPTVVAPIKGRRKSTEVLLQQNNILRPNLGLRNPISALIRPKTQKKISDGPLLHKKGKTQVETN